jgi:hypothetical protein
MAELRQEYLRIVSPANDALDTFKRKAASYTYETTAEQIAADAEPLATAMDDAANALLRVDRPPTIAADVKTLVTAEGALSGTLRAVSGQNAFSAADWLRQLYQDSGRVSAAVSIVRADLGLPPARK